MEAKLTGNGDREMVVSLYREYVDHIAKAMVGTLAFLQADEQQPGSMLIEPAPTVSFKPAPPLKFARGQPILVLQDTGARLAGGEGTATFGVIDESGRRIALPFSGGLDVDLAYDE